jgi:alpha-1,2-mannosyltransferase
VARIRQASCLALSAGLFLLAVAAYAALVHAFPGYWRQTDATVYRDAGLAALTHSSELYSLPLGVADQKFTYTPFAALLFALPSAAPFSVWKVTLAVLTIGLLPVVAYLALGNAGRPAGIPRLTGAFAIAAACLWLEPVVMTLSFGQINVVLLALVVGDLALPDRFKGKGIWVGLAAGVKLTPLIFIPYLLLTRRIRAAMVAALTFAVTIGIGFALLPHASVFYWADLLSSNGQFHLLNQSLNGAVLRLTHDGPNAHWYWLAIGIVVGGLGLGTAAVASRRGSELLGLAICAATGLLLSPVSWSHHYVYVVLAVCLAGYVPARRVYRVAGVALVVALFACWPAPIEQGGGYDPTAGWLPRGLLNFAPNYQGGANLEFTWRGLELVFGNYYVVAALAFVAATASALAVTRRHLPAAAGR